MSDSGDSLVKAPRSKIIKKKTRNRLILLQNLKKGKARKELRCAFQSIPFPLKYACPLIYYLYADVALMQHHDTLAMGAPLYNNFKSYKSAQVYTYPNQKVIKIKVENKNTGIQHADWRFVVDRLAGSDSKEIREVSDSVKSYCQRYEEVVKDLEAMSNERHQSLIEMNKKTEQTRQSLIKTYPFMEFKAQLKDGQIQLAEIIVTEKYLTELGYSLENFAATVLEEGLPEMTPLNSQGATIFAKKRFEKYLTEQELSSDFESSLIMKNGCVKKIKMQIQYRYSYENGVPGFSIIGAIVAKQKPLLRDSNPSEELPLDKSFIELMATREKDTNSFLSTYYNETVEEKYTNINRVCRIKKLDNREEEL